MDTMNTDENSRPFGFWLKAVDRLVAAEFARAFESEGITRREWRLLNIVDGTVPVGRRKSERPLPEHKLGLLIDRGWVTDADGSWALTEEGRTAKDRLGSIVDGIRAKVTDAVPAEDLATTLATLEQLARAFGWDEETPLPRGHGRHRRFGHRHGHDFGHGHGHGHDFAEGHGYGQRGHGHRCAHFAHFAQGAYERGFDSGFSRGRNDR
ncbi:hypothetical protein ACW5CM_01360 [Microbacterium sp. A588]